MSVGHTFVFQTFSYLLMFSRTLAFLKLKKEKRRVHVPKQLFVFHQDHDIFSKFLLHKGQSNPSSSFAMISSEKKKIKRLCLTSG